MRSSDFLDKLKIKGMFNNRGIKYHTLLEWVLISLIVLLLASSIVSAGPAVRTGSDSYWRSATGNYYLPSGNIGIGTVTPTNKLTVTGDINSTSNVITPQLCLNGDCKTAWPAGGSAGSNFTCPTGFTKVEKLGYVLGCIQNDEANGGTGLSWYNANTFCFANYGGRLPFASEWQSAMNNYVLNGETGNWEWMGEISYYSAAPQGVTAGMCGNAGVEDCSVHYLPTALQFRCFIPASGGAPAASENGPGLPYGSIMAFSGSSCPSGWIPANGSSGTPDLRGVFVRGLDNGRGIDVGRVAGSFQNDSMQGHFHNTMRGGNLNGGTGRTFSTVGNSVVGQTIDDVDVTATSPTSDGTNGVPRTANETRPKNVALLYCMKVTAEYGGDTQCPTGFTRVRSNGYELGCIQNDHQGSAAYWSAVNDCFVTYGGRLPTTQEWYAGLNNNGLNNEIDNYEWQGDFSYYSNSDVTASVCGSGSLVACSVSYLSSVYSYRCFIPSQGSNSGSSGSSTNVNLTNVTTDVIPSLNNTYSLGNSSHVWKDLYLSNGSIYIGGLKLSNNNGQLQVNSQNVVSGIGYVNCPTGFTRIASNGVVLGCMQTDKANGGATLNWHNANNYCYSNFGGRLPLTAEWRPAMLNYPLNGKTADFEWMAEISYYDTGGLYVASISKGNDVTVYSIADVTGALYFRCFIPSSAGPGNTGTLKFALKEDEWNITGASLPSVLVNSNIAVIGDYIYLFGGLNGASRLNNIYRAPVSNPTSWTDTGSVLPGVIADSSLAVIGDYIYIFGGVNAGAETNIIYRAPVSNPTSWTNTGSTLPSTIAYSSIAVIGDYVYLFGGSVAGSTSNKIFRAPVSNPTSWSDTGAVLPGNLYGSRLAVIGNYIYLYGGYNGGAYSNVIYRAPVSNPALWTNTGATLPTALISSNLAVVGDYVYLFGGYNGNPPDWTLALSYRAPISNPTSWTNIGSSIPTNFANSNVAIVGDYLYLFSGYTGSGYSSGIYKVPIYRTSPSTVYQKSWEVKSNQEGIDALKLWDRNSQGGNIFYTSGNVGIGTATPLEKLQVEGNVSINGALKGGVRVYNSDAAETYYSDGNIYSKVSVNLGPGTWWITAGADAKPTNTGWWQWGIKDTTSAVDIQGGFDAGVWEQTANNNYMTETMSAVYTISSGTKNVALQIKGTATYPVYIRKASITAIRLD